MDLATISGLFQAKITLAGLFIGLLVGFTGMGGGAFMTPLLIFLGVNPTIAIGSDLMYAGITKVFGSVIHHRQETVSYPLVRFFAYGSVPAALIGIFLIAFLETQMDVEVLNTAIKKILGFTLMLVAVLMIMRVVLGLDRQNKTARWMPSSFKNKFFTMALGAFGGFLVGVTSVGSGTLFIMLMILFYRLPSGMVVGTDIVHATILLIAAGLAQMAVGHVDWILVLNLLFGSVPGVILGSKLNFKSPDHIIRPILAVVLLISGYKLLGY